MDHVPYHPKINVLGMLGYTLAYQLLEALKKSLLSTAVMLTINSIVVHCLLSGGWT